MAHSGVSLEQKNSINKRIPLLLDLIARRIRLIPHIAKLEDLKKPPLQLPVNINQLKFTRYFNTLATGALPNLETVVLKQIGKMIYLNEESFNEIYSSLCSHLNSPQEQWLEVARTIPDFDATSEDQLLADIESVRNLTKQQAETKAPGNNPSPIANPLPQAAQPAEPSFWQRVWTNHKYKIIGAAFLLTFLITGLTLGLGGVVALPVFFGLGLSFTSSTVGNVAIGTGIAVASSTVPTALKKLTNCSPCCSSLVIGRRLSISRDEGKKSAYNSKNEDVITHSSEPSAAEKEPIEELLPNDSFFFDDKEDAGDDATPYYQPQP